MKPIDVVIAAGIASNPLTSAIKKLEDEGKVRVMISDGVELLSVDELNDAKAYWGDPPENLLREWRRDCKPTRRNKSDRKRAPKWGRR